MAMNGDLRMGYKTNYFLGHNGIYNGILRDLKATYMVWVNHLLGFHISVNFLKYYTH
jgi:hypothetical protein